MGKVSGTEVEKVAYGANASAWERSASFPDSSGTPPDHWTVAVAASSCGSMS
ncbi:hypothetical protein [Streptomyces chartreusis]|uniref:hypothetical protein n=1 Tax=Streptomyces chartreusis TaxID=1969 RepID=UPI0036C2D20A